jgi:hypothetical protein
MAYKNQTKSLKVYIKRGMHVKGLHMEYMWQIKSFKTCKGPILGRY